MVEFLFETANWGTLFYIDLAAGYKESKAGNGTKLILIWNSYQKLGKQEHVVDNNENKLIIFIKKSHLGQRNVIA